MSTYYVDKGGQGRNPDATVWIGGLEPQCTEEIMWELMTQAGPVVDVTMPRDKITGVHQGYAFCEFAREEDADYAIRIMNLIKLYGKPIKVNKATKDRENQEEYFANLFIGNLDPEVDEKMLHDTFSAFGCVLTARVMYEETGKSRGYGFVAYDTFESSDAAIEAMNGQFLCNRTIRVTYAFKKDGKSGERHGSEEERMLAAKKNANRVQPARSAAFSVGMGTAPNLHNTASVAGNAAALRSTATGLPVPLYSAPPAYPPPLPMGGSPAPPMMGYPAPPMMGFPPQFMAPPMPGYPPQHHQQHQQMFFPPMGMGMPPMGMGMGMGMAPPPGYPQQQQQQQQYHHQ